MKNNVAKEALVKAKETSLKDGRAFAPLRREPAYLKVYQAIEERIVSGAIEDGAPLQTEAEFCEQFQVTRSTVREGLRLLEQTGLVARGAGKKFFVTRPSSSDVAAAASRGLALGGATFREVWEVLAALYPQAARIAAARLSVPAIEELKRVQAALDDLPKADHDRTVALSVEFFQIIASGLDNRVMLAMLQSLNMMIGTSLRVVIGKTPKARERISGAQKSLIEAIEQRDAAGAQEWMMRHIADLKRGYDVAAVDLDQKIL